MDTLAEEELMVILYHVSSADLPSVAISNRIFARLSEDRSIYPSLVRGRYLRMSEEQRFSLFVRLVEDRERNRGHFTLEEPNATISCHDLERLKAIVAVAPYLVNRTVIKKLGTKERETPPLFLTRNPSISDLLLCSGASPLTKDGLGRSRWKTLYESRSTITNLVLLYQLHAYGADILANEKKVFEPLYLARLLEPYYCDLFLSLLRRQIITERYLKVTLALPEAPQVKSLSSYFRNLGFLALGLEPLAPQRRLQGLSLLQLCRETNDQASFRAALAFDLKFEVSLLELASDGYIGPLLTIPLQPEREEEWMDLDYLSIKLLGGTFLPLWRDEGFWQQKLQKDFPSSVIGESDPSVTLSPRQYYLNLYLNPSLKMRDGQEVNLGYQEGRGFVACRYYLFQWFEEELPESLQVRSVRMAGTEMEMNDRQLNELFAFYTEPETKNSDNWAKELVSFENEGYLLHTRYTPFCNYLMKLQRGTMTFTLQFDDLAFFHGYLALCHLLHVNPETHSQGPSELDR